MNPTITQYTTAYRIHKSTHLLTSVVIGFMCLFSIKATAQNDTLPDTSPIRPVYASYAIKAGSAHRADTYLSPVKYSGWRVGFSYQRLQSMKFAPENWLMHLQLDIDVDRTQNLTGNAAMWYAGFDVSWGMLRRWKLPEGFSIGVGPALAVNLGCLYLDRNGNNPASAKAAITANAAAYCAWNGRILNRPVTLRYQASSPVTGAFFSPDYGELYYEIYLGNHSGLAHPAWWGNYFRYDHQLSADLRFGATWLRVGYRGNILSTKINHIVTRDFTHCALVGISGEWISLDPRKKLSPETRIITATY